MHNVRLVPKQLECCQSQLVGCRLSLAKASSGSMPVKMLSPGSATVSETSRSNVYLQAIIRMTEPFLFAIPLRVTDPRSGDGRVRGITINFRGKKLAQTGGIRYVFQHECQSKQHPARRLNQPSGDA